MHKLISTCKQYKTGSLNLEEAKNNELRMHLHRQASANVS